MWKLENPTAPVHHSTALTIAFHVWCYYVIILSVHLNFYSRNLVSILIIISYFLNRYTKPFIMSHFSAEINFEYKTVLLWIFCLVGFQSTKVKTLTKFSLGFYTKSSWLLSYGQSSRMNKHGVLQLMVFKSSNGSKRVLNFLLLENSSWTLNSLKQYRNWYNQGLININYQ